MLFSKLHITYFLLLNTFVKNGKTQKDGTYDDKNKANIGRRFLEDLDDKEWHVAHLRTMDLSHDDCEKTFEDKAKKYRDTLKNDAALVKFVSGDAIPAQTHNLSRDKCERNLSNAFYSNVKKKNVLKMNETEIKDQSKNLTSLDGDVDSATTANNLATHGSNTVNRTQQRRSEYQFSSVEYYDDVQDFDESICPNTVEIIELEIDQLRSYDVQCEAIVEWRSLE
ncbi:unnamed protein product, partial [Brenthis ino]